MLSLLRHLLDASYLYAQNARPLRHWSIAQLLWALLLVAGGAASWRWSRRLRRTGQAGLAAHVTTWACLSGLILLIFQVHAAGALSARIWYLSASAVALGAPLGYWLVNRPWPLGARLLARALAADLGPEDPPLPRNLQVALGLVHAAGLYLLASRGGAGPWPAAIALAGLVAGSWAQARPTAAGGRRCLRVELLTPLLALYAVSLWHVFLVDGLGIAVEVYRAFPYPDPWSPWFDRGVLLAGIAWMAISAGAFVWRCGSRRRPSMPAWLGLAALALGLGWYVATVAVHLSHGASGSDPYCYLQMAVDLVERGTALHDFPLASLARGLGIPVWPAVHVGYRPPEAGTLAPTVWPIGWSLILAPFLWLGGEGMALWAAPLCALTAAALTWALARALQGDGGEGQPWLVAGLAALITLTSYEAMLWTLVPMADAAAQALTVLAVLCLVQARRRNALGWSVLAGASWGFAYFVRHAQLPLGLAVLPLLAGVPWPWGRRLRHLLVFALTGLLCALPDLYYHAVALGTPWASESPEWFLISWRNIGPTFLGLLRDGWLRRNEYGYLAPFVLYGGWRELRCAARHPWTATVCLGFGGVLLLNLCYGALRLRDLIPLFPFLSLWAARGMVGLWGRAASSDLQQAPHRALALGLLLMALASRSTQTITVPWQSHLWVFGHVSAPERAGYERLRASLPDGAVVAMGLGSGAVERYTGHQTVRPSTWSDTEFARFLRALGRQGRTFYLLDDGEETEGFLQRVRATHVLRRLGELALPTFGLGGQEYGRPAVLYALEEQGR